MSKSKRLGRFIWLWSYSSNSKCR